MTFLKKDSDDILDEHIEGTPFTWRQALVQGSTGAVAVPAPTVHENIIRQARALLEIYRLLGGFTITSWLRTPDHNKAVGGSPHSIHLTGLATDFVPLHCTVDEARAKIKKTGVYPGRTELDSTTWCHYDLSSNKDFYGKPK